MAIGGPFPEHPEEDQRPGKIGPLVKGDTDRNRADRWFGGQRPIASRYRGDRHPVNGSIPSDSGSGKLADDRRKRAADQSQINGRAPASSGAGHRGRRIGGGPCRTAIFEGLVIFFWYSARPSCDAG